MAKRKFTSCWMSECVILIVLSVMVYYFNMKVSQWVILILSVTMCYFNVKCHNVLF
jgi:Flp pilus assembly protein TadB